MILYLLYWLGTHLLAGVLAFAALVVLCSAILRQKHADGDFAGLERALKDSQDNNGIIRLMFVHGMGDPQHAYSELLTDKLAEKLSLTPGNDSVFTNSIDKDGFHYGSVRIKSYCQNGKLKLRTYELTWSPTVDTVKNTRFAFDNSFSKFRLKVNRRGKRDLMNARLADPILYTGAFKEHMQFPVMRAVAAVLDDQFNEAHDTFAIVTYSLGSRMTFDTLIRMSNGDRILNEAPYKMESANRLIDRTGFVFMLANQLPLLALGDINSPDGKLALVGLKKFVHHCSCRSPHRQKSSLKSEPWLHIVSFSDPNDLLSYPLDTEDVRSGSPGSESAITLTNVRISIARFAWVRLFANPLKAHTGFDHNADMVKFLAHGSHGQPA